MGKLGRQVHILAVYPMVTDPTSYYRGAGAFGALRKQFKSEIDIKITIPTHVNWSVMADVDIVFLQRPSGQDSITVQDIARRCGVPVWVDYDDSFLDIEDDNPNFAAYDDAETRANVKQLIGLADIVSVSTQYLGTRIFPLASKDSVKAVIPNAWNDYIYPNFAPKCKAEYKRVMWRGTATHFRDVMDVGDDIIQIASEHPDWTFEFIGWSPWWIARKIKNCVSTPAQHILSYMDSLADKECSVLIAPLADTHFNRAKSNIAGLEATHAGASIIAPDFEEWKIPGFVTYKEGQFADTLRRVMNDEKRKDNFSVAKDHIKSKLLLSQINPIRMDILAPFSV